MNFTHAIFKEDDDVKKCRGCGHVNPGDYNFCENCGMPLNDDTETQAEDIIEIEEEDVNVTDTEEQTETVTTSEGQKQEPYGTDGTSTKTADGQKSHENRSKGSRKKLIAGIIIGVIIAAAAAVAIMMYLGDKADAEYNAKIEKADAYMEELEYEKAETAYLEAIEIEPKEPEAYVKVSDVYVAQEKYEEAENILEEGKEQAGGKEIDEKLEQVRSYGAYDDYINDVIIPETGLANVDQMMNENTQSPGLVSAITEDFNYDNMPDLFTVGYEDYDTMTLTFSLYTFIDGQVELLDDRVIEYDNHSYSASMYDVFLKEHEGVWYMVIGSEGVYSEGGNETTEIYNVDDKIREAIEVAHNGDLGYGEYFVNHLTVAEYYYEDITEVDSNETERVDAEGISSWESALRDYGFSRDRIMDDSRGFIVCMQIEYDEREDSEVHICNIQHGFYYEDSSIELGDMGFSRYLEDYTGLRDRIEQ